MNPADWMCPLKVGYLFPHACERLTPIGCPDCQGGQVADPYGQRHDRYGYDDNDYSTDFTEADGATLVKPRQKFEDDLTAS